MKLLELRQKKGLTQKQLATTVGVSDVTIGHYEKELRHPKPRMLKELSRALDCTVDELLADPEEAK